MTDENMIERANKAIAGIESIHRTGIKVLDVRERYTKLLMPLAGNVNHVGIMYAGSLFTLGEIPGGILHVASFDSTRFFPIVKEINIRFRRPASTDVTLEKEISPEMVDQVQKEAEENDKADFYLEMDITDANGEVVAIVKGTWQIRRIPEGMELSI